MIRHTCHALGCVNACPPKMLMCRRCWALVPFDLARDVYETVKLRGPSVDRSWAQWCRAQARAVAHVAFVRQLDPEKLNAYLERQFAFADKLEAR